MNSPGIIYTPHSDAEPERERATLAVVYALILRKHKEKEVGAEHVMLGAPDDIKESA